MEEKEEDVDGGRLCSESVDKGGRTDAGAFSQTHARPNLWQWRHTGRSSAHFFFLRLHVRHPDLDRFPCLLFLLPLGVDSGVCTGWVFVLLSAASSMLLLCSVLALLLLLLPSPLSLRPCSVSPVWSSELSFPPSPSTGLSRLASM